MQLHLTKNQLGILAATVASFAHAGDYVMEPAPVAPPVEESAGFCDALKSIGTLYKDSDNPVLQEFKVFGRFQYQAAYIDGNRPGGDSFSETYDDYRRVRLGASAKFLQYFDVKANVNMVSDGRASGNDLDWGYQNFDEAKIGFNLGKALGLDVDKLHLSYGRHKFDIGFEAVETSKKIATVERSALSNKIYGNDRPTGVELHYENGPWSSLVAVYSTELEDEFINDWGDNLAYQFRVGYQKSENLLLRADFVYADIDDSAVADGDDEAWDYNWVTALTADYQKDRCGLIIEGIYGDNGDDGAGERGGDFWGVIVEPTYFLVEDRLQLVGRYQYQGSEEDQGIRLNSRYTRRQGSLSEGVAGGGRGDSHHSYYAGLNYFLCGHNAKIMVGAEYDDIDMPGGTGEAVTGFVAFRTYF